MDNPAVLFVIAVVSVLAILFFAAKFWKQFKVKIAAFGFKVNVEGSNKDRAKTKQGTQDRSPTPPSPGPPSAAPPNPLHQIPPPPRDFTGRRAEVEDLLRKIESGGVSISGVRGMGGVGKTALALELAEQLAPRYPDAQIFLDLKGAPQKGEKPLSSADAMRHVVNSFLPEAKAPDDESQLRGLYLSLLHGKRVLLLMDNAADAHQVEPLVPPDGCAMIVTSRHRFHVAGLDPLDLGELPSGDAARLLLKIAPRIGDLAPDIAEICGRLPFALCLAGGALAERPDLSPEDYIARLAEKQKKLELIEATLSVSYDLLDDGMKVLWRTLAVFPGDFDRPAAAAVWGMEADPAGDALGDLLKASLVLWDDKTERYRLHDLARVYADSLLTDEEERSRAERRHAERYERVLHLADLLYIEGGDSIVCGLALFDREWDNVRAGQAWAALHSAEDDAAARLSSAYPGTGTYCIALRQHPRERIRWRESALTAARRLKDRRTEGWHTGALGTDYFQLGDARRAIGFFEKALEIAREIGDRWGEGNTLGNLGSAYADLGDARRAIEFSERHLAIAREIGHRRWEGIALGNLGSDYLQLGDPRRAIGFYDQALEIDREIGDRQGEGMVSGNLGLAYADLGETRRAIGFYEKALDILREIGDRRGEGQILGNLGSAYDAPHAIEFLEKALEIAREIGDRREEGSALWCTSLALDELGDRAHAIERAEEALAILEQIEDPRAAQVRDQLAAWRAG